MAADASPNPDEDRDPFGAFITDPTTRDTVTNLAERRGWPPENVQPGGMSGALRTLGVMAPPRLVILDTEGADQTEALDGVAEIARSGAIVIALGRQDDTEFFRYMLTAGAADYLAKPLDEQALERAITRALALMEDGQGGKQRRGKCLGVIGSRGGVGASTMANNLAWLIAEQLRRRVMLVDLDLQFGTTAFSFDLQPAHGLREALEDPDRIDEIFLERASQEVGERLRVLCDEEALDQPPDAQPGAYATLIETLRASYDVVVLDLPHTLLAQRPDLIDQLSDALIITTITLPGLRDTNRLIATVKEHNPDARVKVAINHLHRRGQDQMSLKDFTKNLQAPVAAALPFDASGTVRAMHNGKPVGEVASRSRLLKELHALGLQLAGAGRQPRPRSLFARLFRRAA